MENINTLSIKSLSTDEIKRIEEFRKSKHTAVLAILFSDIVNSSLATEKLGENTFARLRHIHDELFRQIMTRDNAGLIIKEIGDSFLCVFAEPAMAVKRSIEFQKAIHANKENLTANGYTLSVRIGIHLGQVAIENNLATDIFGRHVNRAARIQSIANGGQVLCSYSVWENANELLNENSGEKISGVSYGKVKLKGIPEKVNIYGFYSNDLPIPEVPDVVKQRKNKNILLTVTSCVLIIAAIIFLYKWNNNRMTEINSLEVNHKKIYYVQFDFSRLEKDSDKTVGNFKLDTLQLKLDILSQIIAVVNPDSVVEEEDFKVSLARKGIFYSSHIIENKLDKNYFKDTLNFTGTLFIQPLKHITGNDTTLFNDAYGSLKIITKGTPLIDSILYRMRVQLFSYPSLRTVDGIFKKSIRNIRTDFRNSLSDLFIYLGSAEIQGYVLNCSDSFISLKKSASGYLRKGSEIKLARNYSGSEGLNFWLSDLKNKIEYYKDKPEYDKDLNEAKSLYDHVKKDLAPEWNSKSSSSVYGFDIGISATVIEFYDSTGTAKWKIKGKYPFEKPRTGDIIYLSY